MQIKKLFRFTLDVEAVIDVEEVEETDSGVNKYFKRLLNQLVNDREAFGSYLLSNLIERFLEHSHDDLKSFLDKSGKYRNDAVRNWQLLLPFRTIDRSTSLISPLIRTPMKRRNFIVGVKRIRMHWCVFSAFQKFASPQVPGT